jgi:hypothetical protein
MDSIYKSYGPDVGIVGPTFPCINVAKKEAWEQGMKYII